jgi:hypothetical protein
MMKARRRGLEDQRLQRRAKDRDAAIDRGERQQRVEGNPQRASLVVHASRLLPHTR